MVSAPSTAAAALSLLSVGLGAVVLDSSRRSSISETTIHGHPLTVNASVTPVPTGEGRPWYLEQFSEKFVHDAIEIRSSGVPVSVASSVAKHLIDDALAPPQYTSLAAAALQGWVNDGNYPNATSLYALATGANSAYNEIHDELSYWSFVNYVQSTAASVFDTELLQPSPYLHKLNGTASVIASRNRAALTSLYSSLVSDPSGKAALETFHSVAEDYYRDFTNSNSQVSTSVLESLLLRLFNVL